MGRLQAFEQLVEEILLVGPDPIQVGKLRPELVLLAAQSVGHRAVLIPDLLLLHSQHLQVADARFEALRPVGQPQTHAPAGGHIHVEQHGQVLQGGFRLPEIQFGLLERFGGESQFFLRRNLGHPGLLDQGRKFLLLSLQFGDSSAGVLHLVGLRPGQGDRQQGRQRADHHRQEFQPEPCGGHGPGVNSTGVPHEPAPSNRTVCSAANFLR